MAHKLDDLAGRTDREINLEWLKEELFAVKATGQSERFLELKESGKKYTNRTNSTLAYALGITDEAPVAAPEITISSGRIDPPDIDLDFEDKRRDEVKAYVSRKWKHVANISTYTTYSSKGTLRDVSRVFAIPLAEVNTVAKLFDTLEEFLESKTETIKKFRDKYPEVTSLVRKFEGRWRNGGVHAAGLVISNRPLNEILPIESRTVRQGSKERVPVAAYDMNDVQVIGLIKMDHLGLKSLSVVHDCLDLIEKNHGKKIDLKTIGYVDDAIYEQFSTGNTVGIFQANEIAYTRLLKRLRPDNFTDLIASNALVRPGALLTATNQYIDRKNGDKRVPADNEVSARITNETYGLYIYQEQLIEALVRLGGFTWPEADTVRKIIAKKQDEEKFKPHQEKWLEGATPKLGELTANRLWKNFLKFAGYAFNKSHACAYTIFMYRTMWLKYYYPTEYMLALMMNEDDSKKLTTYILECRRLGIELLMPDINKSSATWTTEGKSIRYGLSSIKRVGEGACLSIVGGQPFTDYDDFVARVEKRKVNSAVRLCLEQVGAFDSLPGFERSTDEKPNLYELMGYPEEFDVVEAPIKWEINEVQTMGPDGFGLFQCIVKSVEFKRNITKIEVEDASGIDLIWTSYPESAPPQGSVCLVGAFGRDLLGWAEVEHLNQNWRNAENLSNFERLLVGAAFGDEVVLYDHGVGRFDSEKALLLPVGIHEFTIKRGPNVGKKMARVIVSDGDDFQRMVLFNREYSKVAASIKWYEPIVVKQEPTKEESISIKEGGLITAENLMKRKGLI